MGRILHRLLLVSAGASALSLASCKSSPPPVYHDPAADVAFYEKVVEDDPDNTYARDRLEVARSALARDYADQAHIAMRRGLYHEAYRLAGRAASYDARFAELQRDAAQRIAHANLRRAEMALQNLEFDAAREAIDKADATHPDYAPSRHLRRMVDDRETQFLIELVEEFLDEGNYAAAQISVERAREISPDHPDVKRLVEATAAASGRAWGERHVDDVRQALIAGNLDQAERELAPLQRASPDDAEVVELADRIASQRARAQQALADAEAAIREARYDEAAALLQLVGELDQSIDTWPLLMQAQGGAARDAMMLAIEEGRPRDALLAARDVLRFVDDPSTERLLPQLEAAVVREASREAHDLADEGDLDGARSVLNEALSIVESEELEALRDSIGRSP